MRSRLEMLGREAPLILSVVCLLLILAGHGASFGLPDCFWNGTREEPGHSEQGGRFVTGLAVGVFLGAAVFVWLLVESQSKTWKAAEFLRRLVKGSLYIGGLFVAVWLRWAFARTERTAGGSFEARWGGLLPLGVLAGLMGFRFLIEWVTAHAPTALRARVERLIPGPPLPSELREFHVTAAILVGLAALLYVFLMLIVGSVYPGFAICVLLIVLAGVHGFVAFRFGVAQVVVYLIFGLVYSALNAGWQRARVPELEAAARSQATVSPLLSDVGVLNAWKDQQARKDGLPGLVVVAASGGGIRAALWTGVVLTALEDQWSDFPSRLRLITGASGGMLGAAEWTATLPDPPDRPVHPQPARDEVLDGLEFGGLKAVTSGLILRDLLPPPLRRGEDRGRRLERAWESYSPVLAQPMSSLAGGEKAGWRPSLVLTPTVVEDGRFLVISNLDLRPLLQIESPQMPGATAVHAVHGFQLFDYLPDTWNTLHLSTAVRLQANFPYVLPSTEVPGPESGHVRVVDAGYRDDWGVELATSWIGWNRDWLARNTSGVLLIQVRDVPTDRRAAAPSGQRGFLARGVDGLATPISGLVGSWEHTAASRNDEMVDGLARMMNQDPEKPFFATVILDLEPRQAAPLTWSLTAAEARSIRRGIFSENCKAALNSLDVWAAAH